MNEDPPSGLGRYFDVAYIIYLPKSHDRLRSIRRESRLLAHVANRVEFVQGEVFHDSMGFPSIGTRGCVMSFRKIFKLALESRSNSILILQDDCVFSKNFINTVPRLVGWLQSNYWDLVYIGHGESFESEASNIMYRPDYKRKIMLTHCCAYSRDAMEQLLTLIELSIGECSGERVIGPMYFDGYMNFLRNRNPRLATYCATPSLARQMKSKSGLTLSKVDKINFLRPVTLLYRMVVNYVDRHLY